MSQKIFVIEWPDDFGPEWLNIDNLKNLIFTNQAIAHNIHVEVTDVTDVPEDVEELNRIVIGALSDFADYVSGETGHRKESLYQLVDKFVDWKMIKHTGGHHDWHLQCVSNSPNVSGEVGNAKGR